MDRNKLQLFPAELRNHSAITYVGKSSWSLMRMSDQQKLDFMRSCHDFLLRCAAFVGDLVAKFEAKLLKKTNANQR
jgi:hypothetical protein